MTLGQFMICCLVPDVSCYLLIMDCVVKICCCVSVNKQECLFVLQEICVNFVRFGGEDRNHHQLPSWVDSWVVAVLTTVSKLVTVLKNIYRRKFFNINK